MLDLPENPHFESPASWEDARRWLDFTPRSPLFTAGARLETLRVFIRDHRMREVPRRDWTLEAHYENFVLSQQRAVSVAAARAKVVEASYGSAGTVTTGAGREARAYEMGPEPEPDDPDGRMPAVVVWADGEMPYLLASGTLDLAILVRIAESASPSGA